MFGLFDKALIKGRLSAAGLVLRIVYSVTQILQKVY